MKLSIHVTGVEEAQAAFKPEVVQQNLDAALTETATELATPKGAGLGVQVNSLSFSMQSGMAQVESSLVWPRTTGENWMRRTEEDFESIGQTALAAAGERIAAEMA